MLYKWLCVYDVVDRTDRDIVITSGLSGEVNAPNIINAAEKLRRSVENDADLNASRPVSAYVTSCTQAVITDDAVASATEGHVDT